MERVRRRGDYRIISVGYRHSKKHDVEELNVCMPGNQ